MLALLTDFKAGINDEDDLKEFIDSLDCSQMKDLNN